ncbi:hypothetical protein [Saccharothrix xinjiangensis]|uniref:Uncharacterized protein n=1 Tax=Saccharothrix xinjiangensis TaxID=204798 RepID=A0ABV9Y8B6_9PSEU
MPSRPARTGANRRTADDHLRLLCQAAAGPDGVRRVLELIARRLAGEVVLAGPREGQSVAVPPDAGRLLRAVDEDLAGEVARTPAAGSPRGAGTCSARPPGWCRARSTAGTSS